MQTSVVLALFHLLLVGGFTITTEYPASASSPTNKQYVSVVLSSERGRSRLPAGSYLRLVVVGDGGPGGAVAAPVEWALVGSNERLLFAPVNYTAGASDRGGPTSNGTVHVYVEVWTERIVPSMAAAAASADAAGNTAAGDAAAGDAVSPGGALSPRCVGRSENTLAVYYDYSLCKVQFEPMFLVTDVGPGSITATVVPASPGDAETIHRQMQHGLFYYALYSMPPPGPAGRNPDGSAAFDSGSMGEQFQQRDPVLRLTFSQPGVYYLGLYGAFSGTPVHNVVWSPMDGVRTAPFPRVTAAASAWRDGGEASERAARSRFAAPAPAPQDYFQPMALVVPWDNGTLPTIAPGFRGQVHTLVPIPNNRRIPLTKASLTFFHGAHFYIPTNMPYISASSTSILTHVDIAVPRGVVVCNATVVDDGTRVFQRIMVPSRDAASASISVGILFDETSSSLVLGKRYHVLFRASARTAGGGNGSGTSNSIEANPSASSRGGGFWMNVSVLMAHRPNASKVFPKTLSTGLTFGADLTQWPGGTRRISSVGGTSVDGGRHGGSGGGDGGGSGRRAVSSGVSALDTYRRLGLNTVPASPAMAWASKVDRVADPQWDGLQYGPLNSAYGTVQSLLTWSLARVKTANLTELCPPRSFVTGIGRDAGTNVTPYKSTDADPATNANEGTDNERAKWLQAATFYQESGLVDLGYDGCLRETDLRAALDPISASQPDVVMYDIEGWPDRTAWINAVPLSANALRQRLNGGNESLTALAERMADSWFNDVVGGTRAVSPTTTTSMWAGWAMDNKGCCSGSKLGTFDWQALQKAKSWSFPEYYSTSKNLRLMTALVRRERAALPTGWMLLPCITPQGAVAFAGGNLNSNYMFDVAVQLFAAGATGLSLFADNAVDDPGIYLALKDAIELAASYEDSILAHGRWGGDAVNVKEVTSSPPLATQRENGGLVTSATQSKDGSSLFIAVTPAACWLENQAKAPPVTKVVVTVTAPSIPGNYLLECVGKGCAPINQQSTATTCSSGAQCIMSAVLTRSGVFVLAPTQKALKEVKQDFVNRRH